MGLCPLTSGLLPITVKVMIDTAQSLLSEIEVFLASNGMTATAFGAEALNDGHFVRDLRAGKDIRASTIDRVREFIRKRDGSRPLARRRKGEVRPAA